MAYEPTEWKSGDVVTSAKLNKIEQGIVGAGVFIVNADVDQNDDVTLDKTLAEIIAAYKAGKFPIILMHSDGVGEGNIADSLMFLTAINDFQGESSVNNGATFSTMVSVDGTDGVGGTILEIASDDSVNVSVVAYPSGGD